MRRGDVVTVAAAGDYGKPRPAVVVQTDALPLGHASVVVCQMTSDGDDAPDFRVLVEPTPERCFGFRNGIGRLVSGNGRCRPSLCENAVQCSGKMNAVACGGRRDE